MRPTNHHPSLLSPPSPPSSLCTVQSAFSPKGALTLLNYEASKYLEEGEASWPPCGASQPHHLAGQTAVAPPINGTSPACSRPHTHSQSSIQVQNFEFQVRSKNPLNRSVVGIIRVREVKSGSTVKIKMEIKKIRVKVLPNS